jgi:DNA-3-methyladenine glycosylase II
MSDDPEPDSPHAFLRDDDYLGPMVREHGELALDPSAEPFERLVTSVLRQQVSMASAAATEERLREAVDVTPASILAVDDQVLKDAGLSRQKTRYVNEIANAFRENDWDRETFDAMDDDEVRQALTDITGVGDWTADMFLLFVLGREDVFPVGDLGVRKGLVNLLSGHLADGGSVDGVTDPDEMTRTEMVTFAERWRPYRSYAALYLWRVEEDVAESVEEVVSE